MLKKIAIGVAVVFVALLVVIAVQPSSYHVERSIEVHAPESVVFAAVGDLKRWGEWSPWDKLDPQMSKTYSAQTTGPGATYSWTGNDQVGTGSMVIRESVQNRKVLIDLQFVEPFASQAETSVEILPSGNSVKVTWYMDGKNDFMGKAFSLFMNMDDMVGSDYEKGLQSLKKIVEAEARG